MKLVFCGDRWVAFLELICEFFFAFFLLPPPSLSLSQRIACWTAYVEHIYFQLSNLYSLLLSSCSRLVLNTDVVSIGDTYKIYIYIYKENFVLISDDFLVVIVVLCLMNKTCHWNHVLYAFRRELQEELGINLPKDAFEMIFIFLQEWLVDQNPSSCGGI